MDTGAAVPPAAVERAEPIRVEVVVACPPDRAFLYFTRDIARWWPMASHSVSESACHEVTIEPRNGGTIFETARDGTRHTWGTITRFEPGARLAFSWHPGHDAERAQWVEVVFVPVAGGTRVELTQGGFELMGERAAGASRGYREGWTMIFGERFAPYCKAA